MNRIVLLASFAALPGLVAGCSKASVTPTSPTVAAALIGSTGTSGRNGTTSTHGVALAAVLGTGTGTVNVTPTSAVDGFSAQITVNVHDAPPNTTFYVQRAPEIGRANGADGICQRAAGLAPWGPPAPNFVTFPMPGPGPLVTLQTSAGGSGATHIDFAAATIADGTAFDVMFRLVDDLTNPANDLRTGCFTVTVK